MKNKILIVNLFQNNLFSRKRDKKQKKKKLILKNKTIFKNI